MLKNKVDGLIGLTYDSKGDDKQQWLSIFNNEPIVINRKSNRERSKTR